MNNHQMNFASKGLILMKSVKELQLYGVIEQQRGLPFGVFFIRVQIIMIVEG